MGRSKFPGKPSKLVNKKRVSVLNSASSNNIEYRFGEDDTEYLQNDQVSLSSTESETTTTSSGHDGDFQKNSLQNPRPPDPPDLKNQCTISESPGTNNEISLSKSHLTSTLITDPANSQQPLSSSNLTRKMASNDSNTSAAIPIQQQRPHKKKSVTFKNILETSDDVNTIKRVYNPNKMPTVPIIKKECLNRSQRYSRGSECIVRPSRLTEVLRLNVNKLNNIDKLNSLTFKSTTTVPSQSIDPVNNKFAVEPDGEEDSEDQRCNEDPNTEGTDEAGNDKDDRDEGEPDEDDDCSSTKSTVSRSSGDKRFILPKRSAHSCRVIKPNKRFFDETNETSHNHQLSLSNAKGNRKLITNKRAIRKIVGKDLKNTDVRKLEKQLSGKGLSKDQESDVADKNKKDDVEFKNNKIDFQNPFATERVVSSKIVLRQPKLQFSSFLTLGTSSGLDGPFSTNLNNGVRNSTTVLTPSNCGVCSTLLPSGKYQMNLKLGIYTCDACRKFISKNIKKFSLCDTRSQKNILQCQKKDGSCLIGPVQGDNYFKSLRTAFKERCPACWLKRCVAVSKGARTGSLPTIQDISTATTKDSNAIQSPFTIKKEVNDCKSTNLFSNNLSLTNKPKLLGWPSDFDVTGDYKMLSKNVTKSNPLVENNLTFGSLPLMKPTIAEKPVIMVNMEPQAIKLPDVNNRKDSKPENSTMNVDSAKPITDNDDLNKMKGKKKEREPGSPVSPADPPKRQRIDLKGPRVKHVCRSASIVLGHPIATFSNDSAVPGNMDTPPRPDSPSNEMMEITTSTLLEQPEQTCSECPTNSPLSPPATPITNTDEEPKNSPGKVVKCISDVTITDTAVVPEIVPIKKPDELKPVTRKLARPTTTISTKIFSSAPKKLNSFCTQKMRLCEQPTLPLISIDFWENYDPAEVCQTGFGVIVSEKLPLQSLCFLCGSYGQDRLMFCVCCCEPYHQYCVEDEYNLKHTTLDDTNASLMDTSVTGNISFTLSNRLNWLCPRCTVCYTCNMASGSKVKCQKCHKSYHSTCLGTSKRLSGADRPLICASCLKCKSCGTTNVSKFVGNLPMCSTCFKLRQRGNFCPLCQKCYEDNDFNIKMMECGDCNRWVHAKCEGLTDEQYNMLSVLPENIEFICKKCGINNPTSDTWREAVATEFRTGLLGVVRLLSKSRQACALLKLSPRKKNSTCICHPVQTQKIIQFDGRSGTESQDSQDSSSLQETSQDSTEIKPVKCYCGAEQKQQQQQRIISLLDIKQRVQNGEYFSLADFNYDMNLVIAAAACDDLMVTYKEILSEAFPWFQNETKACTDALEEDMYDSCQFISAPNIECDQEVPIADIPNDIDYYLFDQPGIVDTRSCMFCKGVGDGSNDDESRLLYCGQNSWVHANCAMWSAEVFEEIDGSLQNVHSAISRGRLTKCSACGNKGATVGCNLRTCSEQYHYPCARQVGCAFLLDRTVYCLQHLDDAQKQKSPIEKNFEVLRPVYVELDRKRKKHIEPNKVQFLIGSLHVKQLGKVVSILSDTSECIIPMDFMCTRLYWSAKEPWKIVEYTVRTSIQNNNTVNLTIDPDKNFTIDHSNNATLVQYGLSQITKWHSSLLNGEDSLDMNSIRHERSIKQILEVVNGLNADDTNEYEPQNNADLLPPEIKDAIFEDLPHDILDGISMLDIFPKLMTYEDLVALDAKNEGSSDLLRDGRTYISDDDISDHQKDFDGDSWMGNSLVLGHVEDALLSAARPMTASSSRTELKRSKSEIFSRAASGNRGQQRSTSLTLSKLDSNSNAKRRKIPRFDLRLSDGVLLSLGRRKEESLVPKQAAADEIKSRNFTWSATKRFANLDENSLTDSFTSKDKLRISQLDGIDDISNSSSDGDSPIHEYTINMSNVYDPSSRESPVKCDRCHCTYRTQDSYHRHLPNCEPMSTSESDSEPMAKSPELQSCHQQQHGNILIKSIPGSDFCNMSLMTSSQQQSQPIYTLNGQTISLAGGSNQFTIPKSNLHGTTNIGQLQNPCAMQNMIINATSNGHQVQPQQQHIFAQPLGVNSMNQQLFPIQNLNQFANTSTVDIHQGKLQAAMPAIHRMTPQTITLNGLNLQTSQPTIMHHNQPSEIITFSNANASQVMTITPASQHHQQQPVTIHTGTTSSAKTQMSPYKNQLILPQPPDKTPTKQRQSGAKIQPSPGRPKGRPPNHIKPIHVKRNQQPVKSDMNQMTPVQIINQNLPIIMQSNPTTQPIIVQQLPNNQNNIVQYVSSDGHNALQYLAMPQQNDYKPPTQYLTPNPLVPGTFQIQTADPNNGLILANSAGGLQVLPNGTLQLSQTQQPQVIGTIIQQQPSIQCGLMSAEQLMLGSAPTLEMVTNPSSGCMLLTNQPVYYGLETIVQNTVMSSQQFVSTAMQGVLSQNSSFSATTTQVFQASKIEPIMEMPTGYVVLNNEGNIIQQAQQPMLATNVLQQTANVPQMQTNQTAQIQQQPNQTWRIIQEDKPMHESHATVHMQQQHPQQTQPLYAHTQQMQLHQVQPDNIPVSQSHQVISQSRPVIKSSNALNKNQTQNKSHIANSINSLNHEKSNQNILPKPGKNLFTDVNQPIVMQSSTTNVVPKSTQAPVSKSHVQQKTHQEITPITSMAAQYPTVQPIQRKQSTGGKLGYNRMNSTNSAKSKVCMKPITVTKVQPNNPQKPVPGLHSKLITNSVTMQPITVLPIESTVTTANNTQHSYMDHSQNIDTVSYNELLFQDSNHCIPLKQTNDNVVNASDVQNTNNIYLDVPLKGNNQNSFHITQHSSNLVQSHNKSKAQHLHNMPTVLQPQQKLLQPSTPIGTVATTCSNQSQPAHIINLPISSSIQLPSAPYAPSYSNGIPTNVVNPIQQCTTPNVTVSRPTNRVLPMQTVHQKQNHSASITIPTTTCSTSKTVSQPKVSPPLVVKKSPNVPKLSEPPVIIDVKIVSTESLRPVTIEPPLTQHQFQTESDADAHIMEDDKDITDINESDCQEFVDEGLSEDIGMTASICSSKESDDIVSQAIMLEKAKQLSTEEVFDKLKRETDEQLLKENSGVRYESSTDDVKNQIDEMLSELQAKACNKSDLLVENVFDSIYEEDLNDDEKIDSKDTVSNDAKTDKILIDTGDNSINNCNGKELNLILPEKATGPRMLYEIQSQDGFTYKSTSITEIWEKVFEAVQLGRKAHGLLPLPEGPLTDMCGPQMLGLKTNALTYLLEQLPGVERCTKYTTKYHKRQVSTNGSSICSGYYSDFEELKENVNGAARCERYLSRSDYDMFSWLASRHRKQPIRIVVPQNTDIELIPRRGTGSNLPMAMRYRTLKETYKESVGVYRSHIHGRGLFCNRDVEAGEMVIEYAGELIRSTLTDQRERYYDGRGIGCYMFKIDENLVVDATMRGNAARFINHSCEPNCYSKVVDILGHKHIIIFALRRIVQGEELTYDYKFPFEETKIPCSCGSKKCRKYLN